MKPNFQSMAVIASAAIVVVLASAVNIAHAQTAPAAPTAPTPVVQPAADKKLEAMADAEVRKLDKETGKVTLKHGPIKSLDMPSMTMVFNIKDKVLLDKIKAGDKIKFSAVKEGSQYVVTDAVVVP